MADNESVLDDLPSGVSKRATFWLVLIKQLGYPVVVSGVLAFGFYRLYGDILKPIASSHITTLDTLAESSKSTARSFESLASAHNDTVVEARAQKELLRAIGETQQQIKQVLQQGLKIQESAAKHEEKTEGRDLMGIDVEDLQKLFVYHKENTRLRVVEGYGREWLLSDLAKHLGCKGANIKPLLTRENGFFLHEGRWEYNPLGGELARMEAAASGE